MKVEMHSKNNLVQVKNLKPGDAFVMDGETFIYATAKTGFPIDKDNDQYFVVQLSNGSLFRISGEKIVKNAEALVDVEI